MSENKIKTLIVDDEPLAREYIRRLLANDAEIEIAGEAGNGIAAADFIRENEPDLVFLDIQMPEMDGFSMLKTLDAAKIPAIIFTTAYEEFAIRAFEFHALDYLLKPFDQKRFHKSVEYAKARRRNGDEKLQESEQISELLKNVGDNPRRLERLLIKQNGRIIFLKTSEIRWLKADDKYVQIHYGANKFHLVRQTLAAMKTQLDTQKFAQIHRSIVVNVEHITELQPLFNNEFNVVMNDGAELPLSRHYRNDLFELLGNPL